MDPKTLAFHFAVGGFVLSRNLDGITHEESLRAPHPGGNSLNWVVGHIVSARNLTLRLLGEEPAYDQSDFKLYGASGFSPEGAFRLEELRRRFEVLSPLLASALSRATSRQLETPAPFSPTNNPDETLGSLLASNAFHEGYHLGQTGILRRLLGREGALPAPGESGH